MSNSKYFESHQVSSVRDGLMKLDDSRFIVIQSLNLKDPTMMLIISLLAGNLGIDRFMLGQTGMGVGKLLTCGGLGIWAIVDWFMIMGHTREFNFNKVRQAMM